MNFRSHKRFLYTVVFLCFLCLFCTVPISATKVYAAKTQTPKYVNKWVKTKKGNYNYYNEKGKKARGLVTIKNKKYYFNKGGTQLNGWQKIDNAYYYFKIGKGAKAYMLTNTTVNGIKLRKNGKAYVGKTANREKVILMCNAQTLARKIITNNNLTKNQKLKVLYDWTQDNTHIRKTNIGRFRSTNKNWDVYYAGLVLNNYGKGKPVPKGDCYTYACAFGYLANAIGYNVTTCSSGGHGYTLIGKKFYDPSWQKAWPNYSLFGCSWDSYAPGLYLRYNTNMKYTKVI